MVGLSMWVELTMMAVSTLARSTRTTTAATSHTAGRSRMEEYDILVAPRNCDLAWVDASNGHIPTGAIQGGFNEENDPIYIGRAHHEDSYAVGKINPEHGCCYIPFG